MEKLYRFSPITDKEKLMEAIEYIHFACFKLCKKVFGKYLPAAGNLAVFCHFDDEYEILTRIQSELTDKSDAMFGKYFRLHEPIIMPAKEDMPETTYTHLYIRKPDSTRPQVGDVDFLLGKDEYAELKQSLLDGKEIKGARIFERPEPDMVELYDADVDALGYVRAV